MSNEASALYVAFDRFPSAKGAATHIRAAATALFDYAGGGLLVTLAAPDLPLYRVDGARAHLGIALETGPYPARVQAFSSAVAAVIEQLPQLRLAHVRDPWGGLPVLTNPRRSYATVYEINGLPSIELPTRYPALSPRALEHIRALERRCWEAADMIITPGQALRANLIRLGVPREKLRIVPNGAEYDPATPPKPAAAPQRYAIYIGALQPWQGIDTLLRALALLPDDLSLVICAATVGRALRRLKALAERLGLSGRIIWNEQLPPDEVRAWIAHALVSVAPLTACARNIEQGCNPLKIIESLAAGVPVIASDLPVTRELIAPEQNGLLIPPDSREALALALLRISDHPTLRDQLAANAQNQAAAFAWENSHALLHRVYAKAEGLRRPD